MFWLCWTQMTKHFQFNLSLIKTEHCNRRRRFSHRYHLWWAFITAQTMKIRWRDQRNQILTLDVSTSSNLASACAPLHHGLLFHKYVCLSRSYCISLTQQDRIAGKLKWKSTASIFSEMEKILPSGKVSNSVQSDKHVHRHTHTLLFILIITLTLSSLQSVPFNATQAHWKNMPVHICKMILHCFHTLSKWNVQWVTLKAYSVLLETDECESGSVILRWLLYISRQFGNTMH